MRNKLALLLFFLTLPNLAVAEQLRVAVAANFKSTLEPIAEAFAEESGVRVQISSGATGALYTQIHHGAPYDLFLAADAERPALLEQQDRILPGSRMTYAIGVLAFWNRGQQASESQLRDWQQRLSLANDRTAPFGAAAMEVLDRLDKRNALKGKLVRGNNVVHAFQYVQSGNAPAGLVSLAQLKAAGIDHREYWLVPEQWHRPLVQQGVILKSSKHPELARRLMERLLQQAAQIEDAGYRVPPGDSAAKAS